MNVSVSSTKGVPGSDASMTLTDEPGSPGLTGVLKKPAVLGHSILKGSSSVVPHVSLEQQETPGA